MVHGDPNPTHTHLTKKKRRGVLVLFCDDRSKRLGWRAVSVNGLALPANMFTHQVCAGARVLPGGRGGRDC